MGHVATSEGKIPLGRPFIKITPLFSVYEGETRYKLRKAQQKLRNLGISTVNICKATDSTKIGLSTYATPRNKARAPYLCQGPRYQTEPVSRKFRNW